MRDTYEHVNQIVWNIVIFNLFSVFWILYDYEIYVNLKDEQSYRVGSDL